MRDFLGIYDAKFAVQEEDGKKYIEGYAVRFGVTTKSPRIDKRNGKFYYYKVNPQAFAEILPKIEAGEEYAALLYNHNDAYVMASTSSKTLEISVDDYGVFFRAEIADVTYANDVYKLIERGDLSQMSFRATFTSEGVEDTEDEEGFNVREIMKVDNFLEVSIVLFPAFPETLAIAANEEVNDEEEEEKKEDPKTYNSDIYKKRTYLLKIK